MPFATRFALYCLVVTIIGSLCFALVVVRRVVTDAGRRAELEICAAQLGGGAALLIFPTLVARVFFQLDGMRFPGDPLMQSFTPLMTGTLWGTAWLLQFCAVTTAAILFRMSASSRITQERRARLLRLGALAVALIVLSLSLSGHAASAKPLRNIAILADMLHVTGAGAWLGTLGIVTFAILRSARSEDAVETAQERFAMITAFSPIALGCAAVVAISGLIASLLHIHNVGEVFGTAYGRTLLLKLAAVGVVLLMGYINWKRNTQVIVEDRGVRMKSGALRELLAATAVLLITSALVVTHPP